MLVGMKQVLKIAAFLFLAIRGIAQTSTPKAVSEIDLRPLGMKVPGSGNVSNLGMEVVFLSDDRLLVLSFQDLFGLPKTGRLTVFDLGHGSVRSAREIDVNEWGMQNSFSIGERAAIQCIGENRFAIANRDGVQYCDDNLRCGPGPQVPGRFRFSPDGKRFVAGPRLPPNGLRWAEFDQSGNTLATYDEDPYEEFLRSNSGAFFSRAEGTRYYADGQTKPLLLKGSKMADLLGLVDDHGVLCLIGEKHKAVVVDVDGATRYQLDLEGLPWNPDFVRSADGTKFGVEWKFNTKMQLLNPLACIDECPEAGGQRFVIYSGLTGKQLTSFEWDPRPNNLYVVPALSPTGRRAAFVNKDRLLVYALE